MAGQRLNLNPEIEFATASQLANCLRLKCVFRFYPNELGTGGEMKCTTCKRQWVYRDEVMHGDVKRSAIEVTYVP